jgi:hypothetical protein
MAKYLSPVFNDEQLDNNGLPLVGGEVIFYLAGTSTVADTYTTSDGSALQTSPIILNYRGEPIYSIWLSDGISYKARLFDADGVLIREYDNITGINAPIASSATTISEWVGEYEATYISATSFSLVGDLTAIFLPNRRTKSSVSAGYCYGTITTATFGSGVTTIVQVNDSTPLDSGLSTTAYGLLSPNPKSYTPSIPSGSVMPFFQASAPLGWTQVTSHNNKMLRVVSGSGGGYGGSDSPILMNKVPTHTHAFTTGNNSVDHSHPYTIPNATTASFGAGAGNAVPSITTANTSGESTTHTHSGTTDPNGSASNWTPMYINMILAQKD